MTIGYRAVHVHSARRGKSALWAAGVQAELHVWPGAFHGSASMMPEAALSRRAVTALRDWTGRLLGTTR
jgi:acetyl esterase/lipase